MKGARFGFVLFLLVAITAAVAFFAYLPGEVGRLKISERAKEAPSLLFSSLAITYDRPPIAREYYETFDNNGISSFTYQILGFNGREVTIKSPPHVTTEVSYFFGALVQEGIWDLTNLPMRGNTSIHYRLDVRQTADYRHGEHIITFTDPHWWATKAGRQYSIHLDKNKPVPDLLTLKSTTLADPRYEKIVAEFRAFGPATFRQHIAAARLCVVSNTHCPKAH